MAVMAAAAKKELVDQRVQLLTKLGIQTDFIGINAVAFGQWFACVGDGGILPKEKIPWSLFDMGESVSNLTIR